MPLSFPAIDPVAFSIGPLAVRWYGLMYLVGFAAAWWLGMRRIRHGQSPITRAQFDDLMAVLGAVRRVVVVNVKVARPWEAPNNAMLGDAVARWPNTVLVDWHKHGAAHPELFASDGTHMRPTGVAIFVELILAKL